MIISFSLSVYYLSLVAKYFGISFLLLIWLDDHLGVRYLIPPHLCTFNFSWWIREDTFIIRIELVLKLMEIILGYNLLSNLDDISSVHKKNNSTVVGWNVVCLCLRHMAIQQYYLRPTLPSNYFHITDFLSSPCIHCGKKYFEITRKKLFLVFYYIFHVIRIFFNFVLH